MHIGTCPTLAACPCRKPGPHPFRSPLCGSRSFRPKVDSLTPVLSLCLVQVLAWCASYPPNPPWPSWISISNSYPDITIEHLHWYRVYFWTWSWCCCLVAHRLVLLTVARAQLLHSSPSPSRNFQRVRSLLPTLTTRLSHPPYNTRLLSSTLLIPLFRSMWARTTRLHTSDPFR